MLIINSLIGAPQGSIITLLPSQPTGFLLPQHHSLKKKEQQTYHFHMDWKWSNNSQGPEIVTGESSMWLWQPKVFNNESPAGNLCFSRENFTLVMFSLLIVSLSKLSIKIAKTSSLFSNNVNTTIRKYSLRAFIWIVTPLGFVYKKMNSLSTNTNSTI